MSREGAINRVSREGHYVCMSVMCVCVCVCVCNGLLAKSRILIWARHLCNILPKQHTHIHTHTHKHTHTNTHTYTHKHTHTHIHKSNPHQFFVLVHALLVEGVLLDDPLYMKNKMSGSRVIHVPKQKNLSLVC